MKKILLSLLLAATQCFGYNFYRTVTVDHTKVPNTNQTNFTIVVYGTYSYLATVANAGLINNTVSFNGQTVPADLKFTSDSGGSSLLSWDVASYTATTGAIEIWIKIATLSTSVDTVIYMFYGDAAVTTYQGGSIGSAYDSSTSVVYHLANGSTLSLADASATGYTLTNNAVSTATTGQIDGGVGLVSASSQYLSRASATALSTAARTSSAWIKGTSFPGLYNTVTSMDTGGADFSDIHVKSNGKLALYMSTASFSTVSYDGTGTNTLSTGTWYHVAMTYSSAAGLKGYVNGALDGSAANAGVMATGSSLVFNIGNNNPAFGTRYFNGAIDQVRISSVARSADWVATEYNNQFSPSTFYTISSQNTIGATRHRQVISQ